MGEKQVGPKIEGRIGPNKYTSNCVFILKQGITLKPVFIYCVKYLFQVKTRDMQFYPVVPDLESCKLFVYLRF